MKFRPLAWRSTHPHLLADRLEDLTPTEEVRTNPTGDRKAALYGYLRGTTLKGNQKIHLAGVGDFPISDLTFLPDPCPLPGKEGDMKKKSLVEKDRTVYAPMSGVGGVVYDKDAVYIELGGSQHHKKEGEEGLVGNIMETETTINEKLEKSELRLFTGSNPVTSEEHREGRRRIPGDDLGKEEDEDESDDEEDEEESEKDGSDDEEEESEEDMEAEEDENKNDDASSEEETEIQVPGSKASKKASLEVSPSKRTILEDKEIKPRKKLKVASVNEKLKRELGEDAGDFSESDSEEEMEEDVGDENNRDVTRSLVPSKKTEDVSDGVFHRRLTTGADKKVHSKVSEALKNITKKEEEAEKEDSDSDSDNGADFEDEEDEDSDESDDDKESGGKDEESDDDAEEGGDQDETIALNWKEDLAMKARDSFYARQSGTASLRRLVYGQQEDEEGEEEKDTVGGLFTLKNEGNTGNKQERQGTDCSVWKVDMPQDWELEAVIDRIRDCFVTGTWSKGRDAEELMKLDDEEDEEVYGDFEDLETGKKVEGNPEDDDGGEDEEEKPNVVNYGGDRDKELARRKERMERKLKLKRQFDSEYDGGEGDKNSYYEDLKKEVKIEIYAFSCFDLDTHRWMNRQP